MKTNSEILLAFLMLVVLGLTAEGQVKRESKEIVTVSYCQLVREPFAYNQKIIRVHATYYVGFEASVMSDLACIADSTWIEFDSGFETATNPTVLKTFRRLTRHKEIEFSRHSNIVRSPVRRAKVIWVGRFQADKQLFGHQNAFDYQFNVQRIESVSAIPKKVPWK